MPDDTPDGPVIRTRQRGDGWPLCPTCGRDELHTEMDARELSFDPPLSRYWGYMWRCFSCDWTGYING